MSSSSRPAITATGLRKSYGDKVVLDGIDLEIPEGTIFALIGPNGAGKTTTVQILTTLIYADSGSGRILDHDLTRELDAVRELIGVTGQFTAVDNLLTGQENLNLMADLRHLDRAAGRRRTAELLEQFDLTEAVRKPVATYSGGMRRRLDLAMTLIGHPRVIFLDEPTSGLDPNQQLEMRSLIRSLGRERTVILSTHILSEVESICSRVIIMNRGRILAVDSPARLEEHLRPYREFAADVVGPRDAVLLALRAVPHVVQVVPDESHVAVERARFTIRCDHGSDVRREIASAIVGGGFGLLELKPVVMTLEEIFLTLVSDRTSTPPTPAAERADAGH
jgi:ABC-2 type transport system ATP-binding protein